MGKKILTMSLVLVMTLSFTACGEKAEEEVELPLAQDIVNGVIESLDNIRTYQFDMDWTMDMSGETEGKAFEATMAIGSSGAVDLENMRMKMDMTMNMAAPEEDEIEMGMEMYFIGGMMYVMMDVPEMGPTWMKSEIPEGTWEQMGQTESQIELLKTAQVKVIGSERLRGIGNVIGSERLRGIDCYVLQLTPDMEQLWQSVMQQAEVTGGEIPDVAEELLQEMFRSFSVKQWIAKDTYFLTKAEIDMALELTPEAMGSPEEEGVATMDIAMTLLAYNYNKLVSIVLPPEAEEATEVPTNGEEEARRTEYQNVQTAVHMLMVDNEMATIPNPIDYAGGTATNDMTAFPDSMTTAADKGYTGVGTPKAGYVLYAHDVIGADTTTFNTVNYSATAQTTYYYTCEADGTVRQFDGLDVATATEYTY